MYKDTITLFNRCPNRINGDRWYPVVIHDVDVITDKASIVKAMGVDTGDNTKLHIKYSVDNDRIIVAEKTYILPKEYTKMSPAEVENFITFKSGKDFDFFYVGEWQGNEPIADDDYNDGFYDYMNSEYDNVYAITTVGKYSLLPHFEILGK